MKRKPHVQDYNRKINIVFYCFQDEIFEKYKMHFPKDYYSVNKQKSLEDLHMITYNETPDLMVFPGNYEVISSKIKKLVLYADNLKTNADYKEASIGMRRQAYQNYILKVKEQIEYIVKVNSNQMDTMVNEIVKLLDVKGPYYRDHAIRVAQYSFLVGKELNLSEEELIHLKYAALLHDIGLLVLPSSMIFKVGDFTSYEKALYKLHTLLGDYLLSVPVFKEIKKVVRMHHERDDGRGFLKKKEKEIPLFSKIIALCDRFDLMTTTNLFHNRMSYEEALAKLATYGEKSKINQHRPFNRQIAIAFLKTMHQEKNRFVDMNIVLEKLGNSYNKC